LLLGRVAREADSLPSRLQRQKRRLLAAHGLPTGSGGQAVQQVLDDCCARGAAALPPAVAARWSRSLTPRQLLAAWEGKPHLSSGAGGTGMNANQRAAVVSALTDWARGEFGDLDRAQEFAEEYTLQGVRLP
jgi:hypothetical protein